MSPIFHHLLVGKIKDKKDVLKRQVLKSDIQGMNIQSLAVELPINGHHQDQKKCPVKRAVCLWEV